MTTLTIAVPDEMLAWIENQVKTGAYTTASDYMQSLIESDKYENVALRSALLKGEQSGVSKRKITDIITATKAQLANG